MKNPKKTFISILVIFGLVFVNEIGFAAMLEGEKSESFEREEREDQVRKPEPEYVPGELIVKLKEGRTLGDIAGLNSKYKVVSTEEVFKKIADPHEVLSEFKNKLANFSTEHQQWYWQMDKDSQEYKDYVAKLEKEKAQLEEQVKMQEELVEHLDQRQKRAPEGIEPPNLENTYILKTDENVNIRNMTEEYSASPDVEYAEPNYIVKIQMTPNDPYYSSEGSWGQDFCDLWGIKKIAADRAWDISQGEGVIVAVIDTGIDYTHEDLAENIWMNKREVPGNLIDDDLNGYPDDVRGWDFVDKDCLEPKPDNDPMDGCGHGTHVAGTIAAVGNNKKGVIGVAPKAKVMAIKGLDDSGGSGSIDDLAKCLRYALYNGADVINNSWGGTGIAPQTIKSVVEAAYSAGCIVVAAGANSDADAAYYYPANIDTVIAVAASDPDDRKCYFSNWGYKIDVSAPGEEILSTMSDDSMLAKKVKKEKEEVSSGYYYLSGTSMACPHVSGVVALLLNSVVYRQDSSVYQEVVNRIRSGALVYPDEYFGQLGSGVIQAAGAFGEYMDPNFCIQGIEMKEKKGDGDLIFEKGEEIELFVKIKNFGKDASDVTGTLSTTDNSISSIPKDYSEFGKISQKQVKDNSSSPFVFLIGDIKFEVPVVFTLNINANGRFQRLSFKIYLGVGVVSSYYGRKFNPAVCDDKIVWQDHRGYSSDGSDGRTTEIYLYDLSKKKERNLSNTYLMASVPRISKDRVIWHHENGSDRRKFPPDIYGYNFITSQRTNFTADTDLFTWKYSLSDRGIAWTTYGSNKYPEQVFVYDFDKKEHRLIRTAPDVKIRIGEVGISDAGVVWEEGRDIYFYDFSTNQERNLTNDPFLQSYPKISGKKIVWTDERNGNQDIYSYDLENNQESQITFDPGNQRRPTISGNLICWTDRRHDGYDIYIYDLTTGKEQRVTYSGLAVMAYLSGNKIVWEDYRSGKVTGGFSLFGAPLLAADIYMMEISDFTAPVGTIEITEARGYGSDRFVKLSLSAKDTESGMGKGAQMRFSNDGLNWSVPEAYSATKIWELPLIGDVDGDGRIIGYDSLLALDHSRGDEILTGERFFRADVDQNGKVDSTDVNYIISLSVGKTMEELGFSKIRYTVYAKFKDAEGNWSDPVNSGISIVLDSKAPVVSHTPVVSAYNNADIIFTAVAEDKDSGIENVNLFWRKKIFRLFGWKWKWSDWRKERMADQGKGVYKALLSGEQTEDRGIQYYIKAEDKKGNFVKTREYEIKRILDRVSPRITHTPVAYAAKNKAIDFTAEATDKDSGIQEVTLCWRKRVKMFYWWIWSDLRQEPMAPQGNNGYKAALSADQVEGRNIKYYVSARDKAGNTAKTDQYEIERVLDESAPKITHTPITYADKNKAIKFSAEVIDKGVGIESVILIYKEKKIGKFGGWRNSQELKMPLEKGNTYSVTLNNNKSIKYYIRARDKAGNTAETDQYEIKR